MNLKPPYRVSDTHHAVNADGHKLTIGDLCFLLNKVAPRIENMQRSLRTLYRADGSSYECDSIETARALRIEFAKQLAEKANPTECRCPQHGNWVQADDVNRLTRELDLAINGSEGAAEQASLCDIVSQVRDPRFRASIIRAARRDEFKPQPVEEWQEDDGPCILWKHPLDEPPFIGTPLDSDFPAYMTHFVPMPFLFRDAREYLHVMGIGAAPEDDQ